MNFTFDKKILYGQKTEKQLTAQQHHGAPANDVVRREIS